MQAKIYLETVGRKEDNDMSIPKETAGIHLLQRPETFLIGLWNRVPKYIRLTFFSAIVLGLVAHLYMFTNKLPNHDDLNGLFGLNYGTDFGRWFAPFVMKIDGNLSMPWLIGSLSVLCLAGTACFAVSLLRIRYPAGCILAAAIITMFPPVTATFTYMFLAGAYFFGVLLAAAGAWVTVNWRKGFLLGIPMIALAMGLYQTYFSVAAVLMVGALLFETLDGQETFTTLLLRGMKLAGTLAAGLGVYIGMVYITTRNVKLVDYQGISSMGKISLAEIPYRLIRCFGTYFTFFIKDSYQIHFGFLRYLLPLAFLGAAVLVVIILRQRKLGIERIALMGCLIAAYFLAANIVYLMCSGYIHALMIYGLCFALLLPIGIVDYSIDVPLKGYNTNMRIWLSWLIIVSMSITAYSYCLADNEAYFQQNMSFQQILAYSNRLVSRIENCEGYEAGMDVVLVGSKRREPALYPIGKQEYSKLTGIMTMADYRTCWTYDRILRAFCGFAGAVYIEGSAQEHIAADSAFVQSMPLYPETGSCQVIDGQVIVRLN